jgi:hypothetical protein
MRLLVKNIERTILVAVIAVVFVVAGRGSFTFAKPEQSVTELPFLGVILIVEGDPKLASTLMAEVREVSASYEQSLISTALQAMRVIEGVKVVPAVAAATNDMGSFPSPEHSLYPDFLAKRFSQFEYTVDSNGIVTVAASATAAEAGLGH